MLLKQSDVPQDRGTDRPPSVSIRESGQISLSSSVTEKIEGTKVALVDWDEKTRHLTFYCIKTVSKEHEGSYMRPIRFAKDKASATISLAAVLRHFCEYDYKSSGTQRFAATVDARKKAVSFQVPKGALQPRPRVSRKRDTESGEMRQTTVVGEAQPAQPAVA